MDIQSTKINRGCRINEDGKPTIQTNKIGALLPLSGLGRTRTSDMLPRRKTPLPQFAEIIRCFVERFCRGIKHSVPLHRQNNESWFFHTYLVNVNWLVSNCLMARSDCGPSSIYVTSLSLTSKNVASIAAVSRTFSRNGTQL